MSDKAPGATWEGCELRISVPSGYTAGTCLKDTGRAILVDFYGVEIWLALSLCEFSDEPYADGSYAVDLPEWRQNKLEQELGECGG